MKIEIEYDGEYPCLCMGQLYVIIDGKKWDFGKCNLLSGGGRSFDEDYNSDIFQGPWDLSKFPEDFPKELEDIVLERINKEIPWGCCGGCL